MTNEKSEELRECCEGHGRIVPCIPGPNDPPDACYHCSTCGDWFDREETRIGPVAEETTETKTSRLSLENECLLIGRALGQAMPKNVGFALLMFDFGDAGNLAYVSNAKREDMIRAVEEWLTKVR